MSTASDASDNTSRREDPRTLLLYWIAKEGAATWNRWIRPALNPEQVAQSQKNAYICGITDWADKTDGKVWLDEKTKTCILENYNEWMRGQNAEHKDATALPEPSAMVQFLDSEWGTTSDTEHAKFTHFIFLVADFCRTKFIHSAIFHQAIFLESASFNNAIFLETADFQNAIFSQGADFREATFSQTAFFVETTFQRGGNFSKVTFTKNTILHFSSCHIEGTLDLLRTSFKPIPAVMGNNTDISFNTWNFLKRQMAIQRMHDLELKFFAREMDAQRAATPFYSRKWLIRLVLEGYKHLSKYGRSIARPLIALAALWGVAVFLYWSLFFYNPWEAIYVASAHLLPFSVSYDAAYKAITQIFKESYASKAMLFGVLKTTQTILALLLFFLIGLGVRNRLRL